MKDEYAPQPLKRGGLGVLAAINIGVAIFIGGEILNISTWKTATPDSYTIAEAAYLSSLWTKVLAYSVMLLVFDVFCLGMAVAARITQLHSAVNWRHISSS